MPVRFDGGFLYELTGFVFYALFLVMSRRANAGRYSQRTRVLTIAAAIVLVGAGIFNYWSTPAGFAFMLVLAIGAIASAFFDVRSARR